MEHLIARTVIDRQIRDLITPTVEDDDGHATPPHEHSDQMATEAAAVQQRRTEKDSNGRREG